MEQYLKNKLPSGASKADEFLNKEKEFSQGLKELISSKPQMVEDFQKTVVKDLPVERIDRRGEILPVKSGADFQADQIIRDARKDAIKEVAGKTDDVLDYKKLKKEFVDKARSAARSPASRKLLSAVPLAGAAHAALSGDPAMAAEELAVDAVGPAGLAYEALRPTPTGPSVGSLDERIEKGTLTEQDKQALRMQALKQLR